MSRALLAAWSLACVMCGGASDGTPPKAAERPKTPEELANEAKNRELDAILAAEPKVPYILARTNAFRASEDCGQGLYRVDIDGERVGKYGERVEVYACSPRSLAGRARITDGDDPIKPDDSGYAFGWVAAENARCRASEADVARASASPSTAATTTHTTSTSAHAGRGTGAADAKTHAEPLREDTTLSVGEAKCPAGMQQIHVTSMIYRFQPAGKIHVDIWSAEPNDLRNVAFIVQQFRVDSSMTDERWAELDRADTAWRERMNAFDKAHDEMVVHDNNKYVAPPPPKTDTPPPKPSVNAEWVPGYYHQNGKDWAWIPGLWRVPEEDLKKDLTVVAPAAPPPPRDETSVQATAVVRPAPDAVWAPGNWQWDGTRWVWITGAWRLPPRQGVVWQTPGWRMGRRGFTFVPGGWH